jgi:hypothetical protein
MTRIDGLPDTRRGATTAGVTGESTEEQKLALAERQEYETAPPEERKRYHNLTGLISARHPERSTAQISSRSKLHLAGERAIPFWERVATGMPLSTAVNLIRECERVWAGKSGKERGSKETEHLASFLKLATETLGNYDAHGTVRTMNGKVFRSTLPTARAMRIAKGEAAARDHAAPKGNKDTVLTQHKTIVREAIAAWVAARLPKDDPRVQTLTGEFMREVEVVLESFTQRLSMSKPNRDKLYSACDLLNIPRPRWGKSADQKRAWRNRRSVLKSTHPDTLGHEGGLDAYQAINDAYNIIVAYNDSLNLNPNPNRSGESDVPSSS